MWSRFKSFLNKLNNTLSRDSLPPVLENVDKPTRRTCIHEAGHYIVARMFPKSVRINNLSANKNSLPGDMNGALHITRIGNSLTVFDNLMLAVSAGPAASTLQLRGAAYVKANLRRFPTDATGMDLEGAGGDMDIIRETRAIIADLWDFTNESHVYIQWNGFQFVFQFLMDNTVWNAVELLGKALYKEKNYQLTPANAEKLLKKHGLKKKLDAINKQFIARRYPLTNIGQIRLL